MKKSLEESWSKKFSNVNDLLDESLYVETECEYSMKNGDSFVDT